MTTPAIFTYNNTKYQIHPVFEGEHIYRRIIRSTTFYEIGLLQYIRSLKLKGIYIDVGANMGNHSIFFINECECIKLHCFEPHPDTYNTLLYNIQLNNYKQTDIELHNCALGDNDCLVNLHINTKNSGDCKIISENGNIKCLRLDNCISDNGICLIKIDAQGYELKILHGAAKLIEKNHPVLICETDTEKEFEEIDSYLHSLGYSTDKIKLAGSPTYMWKIKG